MVTPTNYNLEVGNYYIRKFPYLWRRMIAHLKTDGFFAIRAALAASVAKLICRGWLLENSEWKRRLVLDSRGYNFSAVEKKGVTFDPPDDDCKYACISLEDMANSDIEGLKGIPQRLAAEK